MRLFAAAVALAAGTALCLLPAPALAFTCDGTVGPASGTSDAGAFQNTVCGVDAVASGIGMNSVAVGYVAHATNSFATAVGGTTLATGLQSAAFGFNSLAQGDYSIAINTDSGTDTGGNQLYGATGTLAIATGYHALASAASSVAYGANTISSSLGASAFGTSAKATAAQATALASGAVASGIRSTAIGVFSTATGQESIAIGAGTNVTQAAYSSGIGSIAIGNRAAAGGTDANGFANAGNTAIGQRALAGTNSGITNATAVGISASAQANSALALGASASATAANAVALGMGSVADVANTVSVGSLGGERRIVNVAAGTISSGSTDAVNGGQFYTLQSQLNSGGIGLVQQSAAGAPLTVGAATDGTVVNFTGTAGTRTLTGIGAGALTSTSTDAVNGAQLLTANERVAAAFGSTLDSNGQLIAPGYTIQGTVYDNVGGALGAVDSWMTATSASLSSLQTQISGGAIGLVQQSAAGQPITIGAATDGTVVDVSGTSGNRTVTGVANGAVTSTSSDAVTGSQLYATNQQVAANTSDIANLSAVVAGLGSGGTGSNYIRVNSSGAAASATGSNAAAIGAGAKASGADALAFGSNAQATQSGAIAMGLNASATGVNAIAIGTGASATGSVAVGAAASAANGGAAFGDGAVATGSLATALGPNSSATAANSVSIGSGSTNTVANTVSFGSAGNERRLTNVAAGINQTDAVNVGQLQSTVSGFQSQLNGIQSQVTTNQIEARRGIVAAVAVAPVLMPSAAGRTTVAVNTGFYRGEAGVGIGLSHRLNFALPTVVYGSYSNGGGAEHIGRAGMAMEF